MLPCSTNAAVVPEKYSSASCAAHGGNHVGQLFGRAPVRGIRRHAASTLAQIGFEDRRRLLELIGEAGQVLQLADRLLGLPHALGGRVDLAAEEIGILPVDRHLGERLDLAFDPIELDRRRTRRSSSRARSCRAAARPSRCCPAATGRCARRRRSARPSRLLRSSARRVVISCSFIVCRNRSSAVFESEQPQEQPEQPIEARRPDLLGAAARDRPRRRARRPRSPRISRQRACSRSNRVRASAGRPAEHRRRATAAAPPAAPAPPVALPAGVDLGVDRRAEPRHRDEPGEVGQLAGADQRQQRRRAAASAPRRPRRRGRAAGSSGRRNASLR